MATKVEVAHADALKLFKEAGSTQYMKWDAAKLCKMLAKLPAHLASEKNGDLDLSKKSKKVLDEVADAVEKKVTLEIVGVEEDEEEVVVKKASKVKAAKGTTTKANKGKATAKTAKKATSKKEKRSNPGVIATIKEILESASKKTPIAKDKILARLVKKFADREEDQMARTLSTQLSRLEASKNENGYWL